MKCKDAKLAVMMRQCGVTDFSGNRDSMDKLAEMLFKMGMKEGQIRTFVKADSIGFTMLPKALVELLPNILKIVTNGHFSAELGSENEKECKVLMETLTEITAQIKTYAEMMNKEHAEEVKPAETSNVITLDKTIQRL